MSRLENNSASESRVDFDLAAAYLFGHIAPLLMREEVVAAVKAVAEGLPDRAREFLVHARSGMPDEVLPFVRAALDIDTAAIVLAKAPPSLKLRFFGADLSVNSGFFRFNGGSAEYVGDVRVRNPDDSNLTELLPEVESTDVTLSAESAMGQRSQIWVDLESPSLLSLSHCFFEGRGDALELGGVDVTEDEAKIFVNVTMLRQPGSGSRAERDLGPGTLIALPSGNLALDVLSPERTIELHSASAEGYWIFVQHGAFNLLAPLPDISRDHDSRPLWLDISGIFRDRLGWPQGVCVELPRQLSISLLDEFSFGSSPNVREWQALAAETRKLAQRVREDAS